MTTYAAFIRGIMPMNPNMRNEKLRMVFENLGYSHVQTVISSGNVLFQSASKNIPELETEIEAALTEHLGFSNAVIIRSQEELEKILKKDPFKGATHSKETYLIVTFLKEKPREVFTVINVDGPRTPEFMKEAEKKYGKEITTRTVKTIERIVKKMQEMKN